MCAFFQYNFIHTGKSQHYIYPVICGPCGSVQIASAFKGHIVLWQEMQCADQCGFVGLLLSNVVIKKEWREGFRLYF